MSRPAASPDIRWIGISTISPAPSRLVFPLARANHAVGQRQPGYGFVGVGDGQAQCVGRVRAGQAGQHQQALDHFLNLVLAGAAPADHGLFHLQRGVLRHRQIRKHQRGDGGAAGLAQQQRGLGVDGSRCSRKSWIASLCSQ